MHDDVEDIEVLMPAQVEGYTNDPPSRVPTVPQALHVAHPQVIHHPVLHAAHHSKLAGVVLE